MSEPKEYWNNTGYDFQYEILDMLKEITSEYWWCWTLDTPKVKGQSNIWEPDVVVSAENAFTLEDLYLAVIECKSAKQNVSSPIYWTHMSRAYMELNDLSLKREKSGKRFYLIVNRYPMKGESPRLDYSKLFKSIDVELVHFDIPEERECFKQQIHQLCKEFNPLLQMEKIEQIELEEILCEILEKTIESVNERVEKLRLWLE